jgi:hypothetical protein
MSAIRRLLFKEETRRVSIEGEGRLPRTLTFGLNSSFIKFMKLFRIISVWRRV